MEEKVFKRLKYGSMIKNSKTGAMYKITETAWENESNFKVQEIFPYEKWSRETDLEYILRVFRGAYDEGEEKVLNIADLISWYEPFGAIRIIDSNYNLLKLAMPLELVLFKNLNTGKITAKKFLNYGSDEYHIYVFNDNGYAECYHICQFGEMLYRNSMVLIPENDELYKYLKIE